MAKPLKDLAVGAVRLAAMAQLGPLAGGVFLAGGAETAKECHLPPFTAAPGL